MKTEEAGATVVITHRVKDDKLAEYEEWLNRIGPLSRAATGSLDWHIVRPVQGLTATYTVIIRFDTRLHLEEWMKSSVRRDLIADVQPLLSGEDDFFVSSGLDYWFVPEGARAAVPVRWKQYLATWSAIYPLVLLVPLLLSPLLGRLGVADNVWIAALAVSGTVVFLMVYVVMPRYTRLLSRWLFR